MKVALYAHRLAAPAPTGIDRYARELTAAVANHTDTALVAISCAEPTTPEWLPPGVEHRVVRGPRRAVHLAWTIARRPRIDRLVRDVDVIHVTAPTFPVPTTRPFVYTLHDVMPLAHPEWFGRVHRWGFRRAIDDVRRAAAVIANSQSTADAARGIGIEPERLCIVPLGIAPAFLAPVDPADVERVTRHLDLRPNSYVVYVGQVTDRKNVAILIEAVAQLDHRRVRLVVAGPDGRGAAHVHALARDLGVADAVRFTGFVPDRDLPALVSGARALVHPSRHEGFGLTPLEAMAAGVPAIVANSAALPDAVGDAVLVASEHDAGAWAEAITSLDDEELATARGVAGRAHARQFTWARAAAATVEVYQRVVGS